MAEQQKGSDLKKLLLHKDGHTGGRGRWWWLLTALVIGVAGYLLVPAGGNGQGVSYKTAEVQRGALTVTVAATGTLQPVNQVQVGVELSGTIAEVLVDYNDQVKQGQILARLDTEIHSARLTEARASLQSAQAKVQDAMATVTEARVNLKRCEELVSQHMCAASDLDKLRAAYERAVAGEAMARAQMAMGQAALTVQETNLQKAAIRSPINGLVLNRNVEPGQTVAASFQTPVLFTLAEDLTRMELLVAVDEADIGHVQLGQHAAFSVDAYPNRTFNAEVTQIRHAPKTLEGVVTYETLLAVDNSDLALLPGMTATADIQVKVIDNAVLIPNAALRFAPSEPKTADTRGFMARLMPGPPSRSSTSQRGNNKAGKQVWLLQNGVPVAVAVKTGATDGAMTELLQGELQPGAAVIVDSITSGK